MKKILFILVISTSIFSCKKKELIEPTTVSSPTQEKLIANFRFVYNLNGSVSFVNLTTPTLSINYQWDFGDSTTSIQLSPTHNFLQNKEYAITLISIATNGEKDTCRKTISVTNLIIPTPPRKDIEIISRTLATGKKIYDTLYVPQDHFWGSYKVSQHTVQNLKIGTMFNETNPSYYYTFDQVSWNIPFDNAPYWNIDPSSWTVSNDKKQYSFVIMNYIYFHNSILMKVAQQTVSVVLDSNIATITIIIPGIYKEQWITTALK